jgi:hypothetical protein
MMGLLYHVAAVIFSRAVSRMSGSLSFQCDQRSLLSRSYLLVRLCRAVNQSYDGLLSHSSLDDHVLLPTVGQTWVDYDRLVHTSSESVCTHYCSHHAGEDIKSSIASS